MIHIFDRGIAFLRQFLDSSWQWCDTFKVCKDTEEILEEKEVSGGLFTSTFWLKWTFSFKKTWW